MRSALSPSADLRGRILPALVATVLSAGIVIGALTWIGRSGNSDVTATPATRLEPLPNLTLPDLRTDEPRQLRAPGRPTVMNFLAYTCAPCIKELPMMSEVAQAHPDTDFIGVHLNAGKEEAKAKSFVQRLNPAFPVVYDPDRKLDTAVFGLPTTIFFDAAGDEVGRVTGAITRSDLVNRLERLTQ
jgi:thiol-disulfide isomerase/thioredoxin